MSNRFDPDAGYPEDESGAEQEWTEYHMSLPAQAAVAEFENPAVLLPIERDDIDYAF